MKDLKDYKEKPNKELIEKLFKLKNEFDKPNPIEGRHDKIFPMFEFESHGDINDMIELESELLHYLGFGEGFPTVKYEDASQRYNKINDEMKKRLGDDK